MKNITIHSFFIFAFFTVFFAFVSCKSDINQGHTAGNISFVFTRNDLDSIAARQVTTGDDIEGEKEDGQKTTPEGEIDYHIEVELFINDIPETKYVDLTDSLNDAVISFSDIPVGSRVRASLLILVGDHLIAKGESEGEIFITEGENPLYLRLTYADNGEDEQKTDEDKTSEEENYKLWDDFDHPIVLWNKMQNENILVQDAQQSLKVSAQPDSDISYTKGFQVFGHVEEGMSITKSELQLYGTVFCLGASSIYTVTASNQDFLIEKYNNTSTGFEKDENSTINLSDIIEDSGLNDSGTLQEVQSIAYYENSGVPYLFLGISQFLQGIYSYCCIALNTETNTFSFFKPTKAINHMALSKVGEDSYLCYSTDKQIHIQTIGFTENGVSWNQVTEKNINVNSKYNQEWSIYGVSYSWEITDLIIIDGYLYTSIRMYSDSSNSQVYMSSGSNKKPILISNGCITRYNLKEGNEAFESWSNNSPFLGLYKEQYRIIGANSSEENIIQPSLEKASSYFYGPVKMYARKSDPYKDVCDQLVIIDDGAYIDMEYTTGGQLQNFDTSKNMNRVVTVDLASESISAVEVNMAFSKTISCTTSFGIVEQ